MHLIPLGSVRFVILTVALNGGGTSTSGATLAAFAIFVMIFVVSFALGRRPSGNRPLSRAWFSELWSAALPRITIAALLSLMFYLGSSIISDPRASVRATCSQPLRPLTSQPVTQDRLLKAVEGMKQLNAAAATGDAAQAPGLFLGSDTHNLTHDLDGRLRQANPELAKQLCLSVVTIEKELTGSSDPATIKREADMAATLLQQAVGEPGVLQE